MPYSTVADIALSEQDLIDLTDDTESGAVDTGVLASTIDRADRMIDSYLGGRYNVPFAITPPDVKRLSATLAKYYLHERRMPTVPDGVRRQYDDAMTYLKDLVAKRATLDETDQPADLDRSPSRILSNKTASSAVFPKSVLDKY